jgi:hypothetical protein
LISDDVPDGDYPEYVDDLCDEVVVVVVGRD